MKWAIIAAASAVMVALLGVAAYLVHTRRPSILEVAAFGHLRTYPAWWRPKGFVYLFSGERGWSAVDEQTARDLARSGNLVFGVDAPEFLQVQNRLDGCIYLPGILEDYSRPWQHSADMAQYLAPAVLGSDIGATLAYEAQVQAPPTAFSAVVAVDPVSAVSMRRPFCEHPAAAMTSSEQTIKSEPPGRNVPLRIVLDSSASKAARQFASSIPGQTPTTVKTAQPRYRSYRQALEDIHTQMQKSGIADLPLAIVPASQSGCANGFAVLYSGDGGWRDLDRSLADILASKGMSVIGVDVLRYYWKDKSPDVAARDLTRMIRYYGEQWHCHKVALIGFSFGADILPFVASRTPPDVRSELVLMTLLSPERSTAFEIEMNGWLGGKPKAGVPIGPEVRKLDGLKVQCVYGRDESADSLCTDSSAGPLTVLAKSGGHHFDQDYNELADDILAALPK
ncbi:MAG TPA: AcvB/VirJ family lysyl-phosphatidylglycerol hydrolase [Steroidobacteraceae bacterium]|jgi:type IV secretory pathway VirJ component|nr:AcvB/VirJ family lysyl-phosphatidylglycerol hydrolase [Steroidobacteraceae bacterium]